MHDVPSVDLVSMAQALARKRQVVVIGVVPVKRRRSLSEAAAAARELRTHLKNDVSGAGIKLRPKIMVSHNPAHELCDFAGDKNVDLLVLPWSAERSPSRQVTRTILRSSPCNVAILRGKHPGPETRILVVLRAGPDSELALRLALDIASSENCSLTALRPEDPLDAETEIDATMGLEQVLEYLPQVEDAVLLADDTQQAVLEQSGEYDLVIIGASTNGKRASKPMDDLANSLIQDASSSVLVVRSHRVIDSDSDDAIRGIEAISILVDKWFAQNTFHSSEYEDLEQLVQLKKDQGVTISLALPALNEEQTVGNVINSVRTALVEEHPLLDEIILIDSDSDDRTREIAKELGIPVHIHQQVLPKYGARRGKGEALWKSLYLTKGDIVLWIDTDIVNIHPRFVYGLIGPLLMRGDLMFVKGFYLRPIKVGDKTMAGGGGRVTELTTRPLLNLFYPALSGLIQPLSGEYGGRRQALEQIPFSSGYGVETGLLIDLLEHFGVRSIGQVDLLERIHHNQPLAALSMMSFAIIQTVIRKLDARYGQTMLKDVNRTMKIIRSAKKEFSLDVEEIAERERPPMITVPEYRRRFRRGRRG
jgi:glucosyl-3-phosphoglycerate synthase